MEMTTIVKLGLTSLEKKANAMRKHRISQGWQEGESLPDGIDKSIRQSFDNTNQGPRWHPRDNKYIRMKQRRNNYASFS